MTDHVILKHGGDWLAMTPEQYQVAIEQGTRLMPKAEPKPAENGAQWLSAKEMAALTGMSETYWQEEARCERCPSQRFGRSLRFPASYLRSLELKSTGQSTNGAENA